MQLLLAGRRQHGGSESLAFAVTQGDSLAEIDRVLRPGGRLALYTAISSPSRVTALSLESASPGLTTGAERLARLFGDARQAGYRHPARGMEVLNTGLEQALAARGFAHGRIS